MSGKYIPPQPSVASCSGACMRMIEPMPPSAGVVSTDEKPSEK